MEYHPVCINCGKADTWYSGYGDWFDCVYCGVVFDPILDNVIYYTTKNRVVENA